MALNCAFMAQRYILMHINKPGVAGADMQKDTIFTPTSLMPKLFYPKKCVNYDIILFSTKLRKRPKRPKKCKQCHKVT